MSARVTSEPPQLRLQTLAPDGSEAADLTAEADGLNWSSVNPGGDERIDFELKREWFAGAPEIGQGKLVRVLDGVDILAAGRIEENDRKVENAEAIGVTAYGLGVRLKDDETFRQIIVDRDLSQWGPMSRYRQVALLPTHPVDTNVQVASDNASGLPAVALIIDRLVNTPTSLHHLEAFYNAPPGLKLAALYYDVQTTGLGAGWNVETYFANDDTFAVDESNTISTSGAGGSGYDTVTAATRTLAMVRAMFTGTHTGDGRWASHWRKLAVYGDHGLTRRGTDPGGFYGSDVVNYVVGLVPGITRRRIDTSSFVIPHLVWRDGVTHEQAVIDATRYENPPVTWGTWGPDSVLDTSLDGQFDWYPTDLTTRHWRTLRSACDDVALNVELATLYNAVDVIYQDAAGSSGVETRTATVPALDENSITRTAKLDGGTLTAAGAQQLGDAFLALSAQRPPARGQITLSQPIRHHQRGLLWPHRLRADGSNLFLPDVLPSEDALSLSAAPDRRTTFPIRRCSIDASGPVIRTTVEVDQSNDTLAVLQARLQMAAEITLGR